MKTVFFITGNTTIYRRTSRALTYYATYLFQNFIFFFRVNGNVDLFDHTVNLNLNSISTVLDRVCLCKRNTQNGISGEIECNYGTYNNCKFRVGKQYHCILNPEGQLRRKRDLRHMKSIISESTSGYENEHKRLVSCFEFISVTTFLLFQR